MKITFHIFIFTIITAVMSSLAYANELVLGDFGHNFTSNKNTPVWSIQRTDSNITIFQHGSNKTMEASLATEDQKKAFWDKMWWRSETYLDATCVTTEYSIICHLPKESRQQEIDLKSNKSDYFHFDSKGGLMEIHRINEVKQD